VRAAEELLTVTRKLKQLWILSEAKEVSVELNKGLEERLQVADVAKELRRILRKEDNGDAMEDVQEGGKDGEDVIEIE
jgi:Surfeit locus protein 5 subunit 22 of Mediator complex